MHSSSPKLSIVVPVYRAVECLRALHERTAAAANALCGDSWELLLVEDRGNDGSWELLCELAATDHHVHAIRLSRNFGQHAAITAGLANARGHRVVVMDCDLQDPPESISELWERMDQGFDIVLAKRKRQGHSRFRLAASRIYFRLLNSSSGTSLNGEYGTFSMISRPVADSFLRMRDVQRHYLFILAWLGFDTSSIEIDHGQRFAGISSYSLRALVGHAVDGMLFQTTVLLRWMVGLGFVLSAGGFVIAGWVVARRILATAAPGWTSLMAVNLVLSGFLITCLGIVGIYVGKVFEQTRERPLYVVDRMVGGTRELPSHDHPAHPPVEAIDAQLNRRTAHSER